MKTRILGIEESEILLNNLAKSLPLRMDVINIKNNHRNFLISKESMKFFKSHKIHEQLEELNTIKKKYDLAIVSSWHGAKLAYYANMKYVIYFIGDDIRYPSLSKKIILDKKMAKILNRKHINNKIILKNAIACVTGSDELFKHLKRYRKDAYRIDRIVITPSLDKTSKNKTTLKKKKFTFFCPIRIGKDKGIDLLWKSIAYCKTDFEILQVNWIDKRTLKTKQESKQILKNKPTNVKLINKIPHQRIGNYYSSADCVIGEMKTGHTSSVEREAAMLKKPILSYNKPKVKAVLNGKKLSTPFLPKSNKPKDIAKIIDKMVENKIFRKDLAKKEYKFMKNLTDPKKTGLEWSNFIKHLEK